MTSPIQLVMPLLLDHERRVREMMSCFGQHVPRSPTVTSDAIRKTRARLLLEEVFEYVEAAGLEVRFSHDVPAASEMVLRVTLLLDMSRIEVASTGRAPDLVGMADAVSDISVVNTGTAAAHGFRLAPLLELTDANNLMKVASGTLDDHGKFIKAPNHPKPDFAFALRLQGWQQDDGTPPDLK